MSTTPELPESPSSSTHTTVDLDELLQRRRMRDAINAKRGRRLEWLTSEDFREREGERERGVKPLAFLGALLLAMAAWAVVALLLYVVFNWRV